MILDGWGINKNPKVSAIEKAHTPFYDKSLAYYPNASLRTFGQQVGLPKGQMGNSEVGHIHIGAGRVVYQNLEKINLAVKDNSLADNTELKKTVAYCIRNNKALHLIGLISDGGVHSHINHLLGLIDALKNEKLPLVCIHGITDGRDCKPTSGKAFIKSVLDKIKGLPNFVLASVVGRFYAMDRDKRWERVKVAYDLMSKAKGKPSNSFLDAIQDSYDHGTTDEFLKPLWNAKVTKEKGTIQPEDAVLFFNFRTDRGRELTHVLSQEEIAEENMKPIKNLRFCTMTLYDKTFENIRVLFEDKTLKNTLGEVLEKEKKTQLRIAETEKYPHVTFFFSGGREDKFIGENRILCPSPREVATYDLKPEMSAYDIKNKIIEHLKVNLPDFICLNFANPDMVGHTGSLEAATKACEVVDECTAEIVEKALEKDYGIFIIADHGNADLMLNPDGSPNTQHSTNPVPFIFIDHEKGHELTEGGLADLAPTILHYMNVKIPDDMTGKILLNRKTP